MSYFYKVNDCNEMWDSLNCKTGNDGRSRKGIDSDVLENDGRDRGVDIAGLENKGPENDGRQTKDWNLQDWKMTNLCMRHPQSHATKKLCSAHAN